MNLCYLIVLVSLMDLVCCAMTALLPVTVMDALMAMKNTKMMATTNPAMGPTMAHTTLSYIDSQQLSQDIEMQTSWSLVLIRNYSCKKITV